MITGFSICNILNFWVKFNIFLLFSNTERNIVGNPIFVQKESTIKDTRLEKRIKSGTFSGVDNGTRTHDLQSHNLTP